MTSSNTIFSSVGLFESPSSTSPTKHLVSQANSTVSSKGEDSQIQRVYAATASPTQQPLHTDVLPPPLSRTAPISCRMFSSSTSKTQPVQIQSSRRPRTMSDARNLLITSSFTATVSKRNLPINPPSFAQASSSTSLSSVSIPEIPVHGTSETRNESGFENLTQSQTDFLPKTCSELTFPEVVPEAATASPTQQPLHTDVLPPPLSRTAPISSRMFSSSTSKTQPVQIQSSRRPRTMSDAHNLLITSSFTTTVSKKNLPINPPSFAQASSSSVSSSSASSSTSLSSVRIPEVPVQEASETRNESDFENLTQSLLCSLSARPSQTHFLHESPRKHTLPEVVPETFSDDSRMFSAPQNDFFAESFVYGQVMDVLVQYYASQSTYDEAYKHVNQIIETTSFKLPDAEAIQKRLFAHPSFAYCKSKIKSITSIFAEKTFSYQQFCASIILAAQTLEKLSPLRSIDMDSMPIALAACLTELTLPKST